MRRADVLREGARLGFRAVLVAIAVLTVLGSSHALRYVLCGVLLATVLAEMLWSARNSSPSSSGAGPDRP